MRDENWELENIEVVPWHLQEKDIKHRIYVVSFSRNIALTSQEQVKKTMKRMGRHDPGEGRYSVDRVNMIKLSIPENLSNYQEAPIFFCGPEEDPKGAIPIDVYNSLFQFRV